LIGIVVAAWFVPQVVALFAVPGVADDALDSARGIIQWNILPEAGAAAIAIWMIVRLDWVADVRHERWPTERWVVLVPVTMLGVSIATIDVGNLVEAGLDFVLLLLISTFLIGLNEELLFRGLALRAFRDRHREWVAAAWSSVFFGLFHLFNIIVAGGAAAFQAVWAIAVGYLLYLCRRVGGGMVLPVCVHAVWDFSSFSPYLRDSSSLHGGRAFIQFMTAVVLIVVVRVKRASIPASPDRSEALSGSNNGSRGADVRRDHGDASTS
jgi:hypothetical protein